jgi:ubiquinone/menaquinone biosynthesis C-methylase UbiE
VPVNAQYNVSAPDSFAVRLAGYQRRRMYARFLTVCGVEPGDSIADVGATSDRTYDHSNYFEAWYPHKSRITAIGIDDASFLEQAYPGVTFRLADGRALPFEDGAFDFVHSSAVIEHVGSRAEQQRLLAELWRVCRKGLFVTTPNRWFPVEFHSVLPFVHWLPARAFRAILRARGHDTLAEEAHLNLLSRRDLERIAREAGITAPRVTGARLAGWTSNLLLVALKRIPHRTHSAH